ncbi:hypothetical protein A7J67_10360 [Achromobacter xylosoxidans]|nr:hypothetical protein A7J67_10360 [Achromobacter xylosoxidans]
MTTNDKNIPKDPTAAAAHWFTREHGGLMTSRERERFEAWRAADPQHERAYQQMLRVWDVAAATPDHVFEKALAPRSPAPQTRFKERRRMLALGVGAACCAAIASVALGPEQWSKAPVFDERYVSQRGERRNVDLPDGSVLTLNTDTVVHVQFFDVERRVNLERGEAFFSIAHAPQRPFIVVAGDATVTVTGTQFNVRRSLDQVSVAVASGSVEVAGGKWWNRRVRRLSAAQIVQVGGTDAMSEISRANMAVLTAWRQGKIIFDATPLATIVAEINRYRAQPVRLPSPALQSLRVTGVFSTVDPDAFLKVLPSLASVTVLQRSDGSSEIHPR